MKIPARSSATSDRTAAPNTDGATLALPDGSGAASKTTQEKTRALSDQPARPGPRGRRAIAACTPRTDKRPPRLPAVGATPPGAKTVWNMNFLEIAATPTPAPPRQTRPQTWPQYVASLVREARHGMTITLAIAGSLAYRRDPVNFRRDPMQTILGYMTLKEPIDLQVVGAGKRAVLDRFGKYIPPQSYCHQVVPSVSFDPGFFTDGYFVKPSNDKPAAIVFNTYQPRGTVMHMVAHEYLRCFASPDFDRAASNGGNHDSIDRGLAEHLADKIPGPPASKWSDHDFTTIENGKRLTQAAVELERAVGKKTLLKAYFGGDRKAIATVSRAAVNIYPKNVSPWLWKKIGHTSSGPIAAKMAECFVAASLVDNDRVPADHLFQASENLPLRRFGDLTAKQKRQLREQGLATRDRLGAAWDQAFYNFDKAAGLSALDALYKDLEQHWKPVLLRQA